MARRRRRDVSQGNDGEAGGTRESEILNMIYGHYKEALNKLPLEHMPALAQRLLDAGVCFGIADPVTSIIANTVCFLPGENGEPETNGAKKRKRTTKASRESGARKKAVLSKIVAGDASEARTIAERSLDGPINFLTCYFRYLHPSDAMHYLFLARADILVAVHLIDICCNCRKIPSAEHSL